MLKFFYRVEQGDTVFSLSNKFSISPFKIIKQNNLKREISQGDLLYIERGDSKKRVYKVQPFETLTDVAKRFNVAETQILENNGIEYVFYGLILEI